MDLLNECGLRPGDLVFVDSAPLVYLIEGAAAGGGRGGRGGRGAALRALAEAAGRGEIALAASALAWTECLAGAMAAGGDADAFRRFLADSRRLVLEPVDAAVAEEAARLLASFGRAARSAGASGGKTPRGPVLELPDAVHLASAATRGAAAVLTNDEAWRPLAAAASETPGPRGAAYKRLKVLISDELDFLVS